MSTATRTHLPVESSGPAGKRQGKVSEFTVIAPLKEGGAGRLRALLSADPEADMRASDRVGTVHDMRFVIFDDDTRLLFSTAYDGDVDPYLEDFVAKIPDELDYLFSEVEGWPGASAPGVKDFIYKYQLTADFWYCAYPESTVKDVHRGQRIMAAVDQLLDASQS
jgi:hypothetical protein